MDVARNLSRNLKHLRAERKLSLDDLADLSGVSKSMLGQIEREAANPSISTLWKIANGLKVSFTSLISDDGRHGADLLRWYDTKPIPCNDSGYRCYPVYPFDAERRFEIYAIEIVGGSGLTAQPHPAMTQEFLTVFTGNVSVVVGETRYTLTAGDFMSFRADCVHSYRNESFETARLSMVLYYPS